eukprot:1723568-Alexandrium_andersonii.AAC.1
MARSATRAPKELYRTQPSTGPLCVAAPAGAPRSPLPPMTPRRTGNATPAPPPAHRDGPAR